MRRVAAVQRSLACTIGCLPLLLGCSHEATSPFAVPILVSEAVVSSPLGDGRVYVGMKPKPGLVPGLKATIRDQRSGTSVVAVMEAGGFDPVTVAAEVGDTLFITLQYSATDKIVSYAVVPERSNPVVLRTLPGNGASSVAVSDSMVAIFSEPIDASSLTGAIGLTHLGGGSIGTTVSSCGNGLCAALAPSALLAGYSAFRFFVSDAVKSRGGVGLARAVADTFTTGVPPNGTGALDTPPLVVRAFSVVEYQVPGDTVDWFYAPRLTVENVGPMDADVTTFGFQVPGIGGDDEGACKAVIVPYGATADVFLEAHGAYEISIEADSRATPGEATATLQYLSGVSFFSSDLHGPVVSGAPPTTDTDRTGNWSADCR